ncbi:MAG: ComF family protein [Blastocatellales bacterium]
MNSVCGSKVGAKFLYPFDTLHSVTGKAIAEFRDAALAMLFPTACRACDLRIESWRDGIACDQCWTQLEQKIEKVRLANNLCEKCGMPLAGLPLHINVEERRCGRCHDLAFNFARACGIYEGPLRESVLWLKRHPQIHPRLRSLLRSTFISFNEKLASDVIVPVPLHKMRLAERTFNQAEILAREISVFSGLYVDTASLIRNKQTERHRAGMGARERSRSLKKAFRVRAPRLIKDKTILLVDDVMTTGSTAHEIAQTLLEHGARSINVLTLARAASEFTL